MRPVGYKKTEKKPEYYNYICLFFDEIIVL